MPFRTVKTLSLVIPVFNAPDLARAVLTHLPELDDAARAAGFTLLEVLFVDDGSTPPLHLPPLADVLPTLRADCRILRLPRNSGKGAAVRHGALAARGDWVLMSDVDLSAPLSEFAAMAPHAQAWMVCASRAGRTGMPRVRRVLSYLFNVLARITGVGRIQDTQCGFKLFRMDVMRPIFAAQRVTRFAFDVELIVKTKRAGGTIMEVPVVWHGTRRSSLRVCRDAPRMMWDLLAIAFRR